MSSGKCGDNLTWTLDDGTLTISGHGKMDDYGLLKKLPWYNESYSIKEVIINNGVTSIGDEAFSGCHSLTSITIPDSVTAIGMNVFSDCKSLTSVMIPDSVTTIGWWAFEGCTSLINVIIPNSVTTIGWWAFEGCHSLTSVIIPDSVTTIGWQAFSGCHSLTSITIPDSVTTIGWQAFCDCKSLTSVIIPDSVTTIGWQAFCDCKSLKEIHYPSGRGFEQDLSQGNNAKLIPHDELPPELKADESVAEFDKPDDTKENVEPPAQVKPPAETNCTVYRNTKISRAENIAPLNTKSLSRVDENITEIRRAAELAAMNIVMTIERNLGFSPEDVSSQNLGYDIKSTSRDGKISRLIEVKGRYFDAETVTVSRNEIIAALNNPDNFILAIVKLDADKNETIYLKRPFEQPPDRAALSVNFSIQKLVEAAKIILR